jgi:hypothetical protein
MLWSTDTGHDTDTTTSIIIWKNDIIQCNRKYRIGVGHWHEHVSDTPNPRSVRAYLTSSELVTG